jgi:hypothetical protein
MARNDHAAPAGRKPVLGRRPECRTRRRTISFGVLAAAVCISLALGEQLRPQAAGLAQRQGTFVGVLEGTAGVDIIGIHVGVPDAKNRRVVRAYLSDGVPGGYADWCSGTMLGMKILMTSTSGHSTVALKLGPHAATGLVTFSNGARHPFIAPLGTGGAGIYDVEVGDDGVMHGVSLAGDVLTAIKSDVVVSNFGDGRPYELIITSPSGQTYEYLKHDLTTLSVAELLLVGMPATFATSGVRGLQPDRYTAVWLARDHVAISGRSEILWGRSGDVRAGSPGLKIIGLDLEY